MSDSIRFDRAADFYDRTRALDPEAMGAVVELLGGEVRGRGRCLEVGVGTGRIALPLHDSGIAMAGVDLSSPMLDRLVANAGGRIPFPLAEADATRLPLKDASMGAALACHVLHLIVDWPSVLQEMARVVRRPAVVLIDPGGVPWIPDELEQVFREAAGITARNVGLQTIDDLDDAMRRLGATVRELRPVDNVRRVSAEQRIQAWESNLFSFTWRLDDDVRMSAAASARAWAARNLEDPEAPAVRTTQIRWRAYDLA